ncbi:unnamed protein product [Lepeophtheirus salmonis]|uniref:(salmon louse) hypothetical protein n=1 Tax=Lepeophtheirus salmonis TaxID=72036 RepID=A0A817FAL8_LEPSM|nr:unnamed protein product [Lepeophtheirus salmonis]CAG9476428.1 unnamed protein product [Lepeophtheirus salmonis]
MENRMLRHNEVLTTIKEPYNITNKLCFEILPLSPRRNSVLRLVVVLNTRSSQEGTLVTRLSLDISTLTMFPSLAVIRTSNASNTGFPLVKISYLTPRRCLRTEFLIGLRGKRCGHSNSMALRKTPYEYIFNDPPTDVWDVGQVTPYKAHNFVDKRIFEGLASAVKGSPFYLVLNFIFIQDIFLPYQNESTA